MWCSFRSVREVSHISSTAFAMDDGAGGEGRAWHPLDCLRRMLYIATNAELHIWPQLTKDNVQRSYLNFKEDE